MENKQKLNEMLNNALVLAANGHSGQYDRGGNPYVLHVLSVMQLVDSTDIEVKVIAALHDIVEDTKTTFQDLKDAGMSDRVIDGVRRLTKMPGQSYEEYQQGIFESRDAMLVKAADLTHNSDIRRLKGITQKDIDRMAKYAAFFTAIQMRLNA